MRILIVEDDVRIARNIGKILRKGAFAVDLAFNGAGGFEKARDGEHDLLIIDWVLPDFSGLDLCRKLRSSDFKVPILILSARGELEDKVEGLESGADDYLTKPFAGEELIARVKALLRRGVSEITPAVYRVGDLEVDTNACRVTRAGREIELSPKEYALLAYLVKFQGKALERMEILTHVWDENVDLFSNTVDVHIRYLRRKIDHGFRIKLIKTVKGKGYMLWGG